MKFKYRSYYFYPSRRTFLASFHRTHGVEERNIVKHVQNCSRVRKNAGPNATNVLFPPREGIVFQAAGVSDPVAKCADFPLLLRYLWRFPAPTGSPVPEGGGLDFPR